MNTAFELAYTNIKHRIVSGELAAGENLKERDLCAELGLSRTPIREALRRLNAEGLVTARPRRSMIVAELSEKELREIFQLGSVLESFACRLAAKSANDADLEKLDSLLKSMDEILSSPAGDIRKYADLDRAFHRTIVEMSGNQRLSILIEETVSVRILSQVYQKYGHEDCLYSFKHHQYIYDAIKARDPEAAAKAMATHISGGKK